MIIADLIEWASKQKPTDTAMLMIEGGSRLILEQRFLVADDTRTCDQAAAERFRKAQDVMSDAIPCCPCCQQPNGSPHSTSCGNQNPLHPAGHIVDGR